ncbi:MAG: YncE family protein [Candidatus Dependentiae bacterium]|nr:YncE family protein [Candidatus Dependentiae bacterium]
MKTKQFLFSCAMGIGLLISQNTLGTTPNTITGIVSDPDNVIASPTGLAITSDGLTAYVISYCSSRISIIDISTNTVTGIVSDPGTTLSRPHAIAITPNNATAYVVNSGNNTVSILDIATNTITGTVIDGTFCNPIDVAITPDGTTAYVVNNTNNSVSKINVATNLVTQTITSEHLNLPIDVAISPDGTYAYIANNGSSTVAILDIASDTITGLISNIYGSEIIKDVIFTHNGAQAYVSINSINSVYVVLENTAVTGMSITQPIDMTLTPDNSTAYVIQSGNVISVVDATINAVTGIVADPLNTLNRPQALAITPDGSIGYIANECGNTVSIMFIKDPPVTIHPPIAIKGCKTKNVFLTQTDTINMLTWRAPTQGAAPIVYTIYRNAGLTNFVASVPATGPLHYADHNRNPAITYSYYLVSVDQHNNVSSPSSVTVTSSCK